jgi:hypothetical protein
MAQVVECLSSKGKALSSNPNTPKRQNERNKQIYVPYLLVYLSCSSTYLVMYSTYCLSHGTTTNPHTQQKSV